MPEYTDPTTVEPGRAGTATVDGVKGVRVFRVIGGARTSGWVGSTGESGSGYWHNSADITDLVLDPLPGEAPADSITLTREELADDVYDDVDPESLREYAKSIASNTTYSYAVDLLRLVANKLDALPKPVPPIFEPDGLGAVVIDRNGNKFVRVEPDGGVAKWVRSQAPDATDPRYVWSAIDAVEVLSEGVATDGD